MAKRLKLLVITATALFLFAGIASAAASWGSFQGHPIVRTIVDGKEVKGDVPAFIIQSRTMVPFRLIAEALGAEVAWDQENRTVTVNSRPVILQAVMTKALKESTVDKGYKVPDGTREEFELKDSRAIVYVQAWDDGKPHKWTATWTDNTNNIVYKEAELEVKQIKAKGTVPARLYLTDTFALSAPLVAEQVRLPAKGEFTVTIRRDGAVVAKVPFWFE